MKHMKLNSGESINCLQGDISVGLQRLLLAHIQYLPGLCVHTVPIAKHNSYVEDCYFPAQLLWTWIHVTVRNAHTYLWTCVEASHQYCSPIYCYLNYKLCSLYIFFIHQLNLCRETFCKNPKKMKKVFFFIKQNQEKFNNINDDTTINHHCKHSSKRKYSEAIGLHTVIV